MNIRNFRPGDELVQVAIYNAAACRLPGFKPAKLEDVQRRTRVRGFDPSTRFYAEVGGEIVGYCTLDPEQGRVSYPWCKRRHELEKPLFEAAIAEARARGVRRLFAAYRRDWKPMLDFFENQGFRFKREMVNFASGIHDLPTMRLGAAQGIRTLDRSDLPALAAMGQGILALPPIRLEQYFFANPYYPAECVRVLRTPADEAPIAFGLMIEQATYANVLQIDSNAPCFRLGAFGTEGRNTKRVNGLFSFLVRDPKSAISHGLALLADAMHAMTDGSIQAIAAQCPSDVPHLLGFYERYFKEQGRFPVYEANLLFPE